MAGCLHCRHLRDNTNSFRHRRLQQIRHSQAASKARVHPGTCLTRFLFQQYHRKGCFNATALQCPLQYLLTNLQNHRDACTLQRMRPHPACDTHHCLLLTHVNLTSSQDSSDGVVTRLRTGRSEEQWFQCR
jgi:hypothetical protein